MHHGGDTDDSFWNITTLGMRQALAAAAESRGVQRLRNGNFAVGPVWWRGKRYPRRRTEINGDEREKAQRRFEAALRGNMDEREYASIRDAGEALRNWCEQHPEKRRKRRGGPSARE